MFCEEDVVVKRKSKFSESNNQEHSDCLGIVTKTWDEEQDKVYPELEKPYVKVCWFRTDLQYRIAGTEYARSSRSHDINSEITEILREDELDIVDRSVLPSDIVTSSHLHHKMTGTVLSLSATYRLEHFLKVSTGASICQWTGDCDGTFDSSQVKNVFQFEEGSIIVYDNRWIGAICSASHIQHDSIILINGSFCQIPESVKLHLLSWDGIDDEYFFFKESAPGNAVQVSAKSIRNKAKWIYPESPVPVKGDQQSLTGVLVSRKPTCLKVKWMILNPVSLFSR